VSSEEPNSFDEAEQDPCWRRAMLNELRSIEENQTWVLTDLPLGRRAIGLKWVFNVKRDEHGNIAKHKARLVVKGYAQRCGLDYDEMFAPVARLDSVSAHRSSSSRRLGNTSHGCQICISQWGASRRSVCTTTSWFCTGRGRLHSFGFRRYPFEPAVYTRKSEDRQLVIGVYVDDLMITGTNSEDIKKFKTEMAKVFNMSDLGLLHYYHGIEVQQGKRGITLSQSAYALKILEKSGLRECNPSQAPMESRLKLSKQSSELTMDQTLYRSLVGSLRYHVNTRLILVLLWDM
jgi:hypothetical protein